MCEDKNQSWILQGFPRTKVQALSLQKIGIIPDKFILLNIKPNAAHSRIKNNLIQITPQLYGAELEDLATQCLQEYDLNIEGVRQAFNQFIFEVDFTDKAQQDVCNDIYDHLELRFKSGAPRRPPRVIIAGPPGSGKYTQAKKLSEIFGMVHVSMNDLLKKEIATNREFGKHISECIDNGDPVPDHIINGLIEKRLNQTDCRVNGWVMDGFPKTKAQINLLKAMRLRPAVVFVLE